MKFTPGQHVISNGTLYIYRHDLPGSNHPIVLHRSSIRTESAMTPTPTKTSADVQTSIKRPAQLHPQIAAKTAAKVDVLSTMKADALDAQAARLEGYAKTLRDEAAALRRGEV